MTSAFDNLTGSFHALINDEGQYSLWPAFVAVPAGWSVALADSSRDSCVEFIDKQWSDIRPRSLLNNHQNLHPAPKARPSCRSSE